MVINVIVYLICTFTGDLLYNIGELDAVAVLRYGEYGRILSLYKNMLNIDNL